MARDDDLTDDQLLTVPGEDIPSGRLAEYFARRAMVVHDRAFTETMLELSGDSTRHLMIFAGQDPRERRRIEDDSRRRAWLASQEMEEYRRRLARRIEEQLALVQERFDDIDRRAIKLHDGRRAYVDGDHYVDGQGRVLTGVDDAEARAEHANNPHAATAQELAEAERQRRELERLQRDVEAGQGVEKQDAASDYEKRFRQATETRSTEIEAKPDDYSADYMTAYAGPSGGEGRTATTAFSSAVSGYENASREAIAETTQKEKLKPA
jgi:hypothetical protein